MLKLFEFKKKITLNLNTSGKITGGRANDSAKENE